MARHQKSQEKESQMVKPGTVHKHFSQTEFPQTTLQEAQKLAMALMDQYEIREIQDQKFSGQRT